MEEKWLIDKNERTLDYYIKQLDFTKPYAKERLTLIREVLSVTEVVDTELNNRHIISNDEWLKGYIGSLGFKMQQLKTKANFLCEDEPFCKGLERLADYLIFPKYNDEEDETKKINRKKETLSKYKKKKNAEAEMLFGDKTEGSGSVEDALRQKTFRVQVKPEVTEKDLQDFEYLREMNATILALAYMLGYGNGFSKEQRETIQGDIKNNHGERYLRLLTRVYSELKSESLLMKEQLRGTIYFKHLTAGDVGAVLTLDEDTGYFLEDTFEGVKVDAFDSSKTYKAGDYVPITEGKIDFNVAEHVQQLLNLYTPLKETCVDKPDSEMWHIINTLEELIDKTELTTVERKILELKIDGLTGTEIRDILIEEDDLKFTEQYISQVFLNIPDKLVETHVQMVEDWLYTYKAKGLYKCCTVCKENKLATKKYFSVLKKGKYGLNAACKSCRNSKAK